MNKLIGGAALLFLVGGTGSRCPGGALVRLLGCVDLQLRLRQFPAVPGHRPRRRRMVSAEFFRALRRRSAADRQEDARGALLTFRLLW